MSNIPVVGTRLNTLRCTCTLGSLHNSVVRQALTFVHCTEFEPKAVVTRQGWLCASGQHVIIAAPQQTNMYRLSQPYVQHMAAERMRKACQTTPVCRLTDLKVNVCFLCLHQYDSMHYSFTG